MYSIEMCHQSGSTASPVDSSNTNRHHHHHHQHNHSSFDLEGLEESLVDNNEDDDDDEDDNFLMMDTMIINSNHHRGMNDSSIIQPLTTTTATNGPITGTHSPGIIFDHNLYLIREALIRDSNSRTEDDIEIIVRFLSIINSNHDHMTRRRLAPHFVLAEIEARDTRVLTHGEKLDAYCIVAAGSLRHVLPCDDDGLIIQQQDLQETSVDDDNYMVSMPMASATSTTDTTNSYLPHHQPNNPQVDSSNVAQITTTGSSTSNPNHLHHHNHHHHHHHHHQNTRYLHVGDEFGAHLDDRVVYGEIFTNEDFVWVLCVPHVIFDQICGEKTFKTIRDEVTGNIIEMRTNCLLPPPPSISSSVATGNNQQQHQLTDDINSLGSTNLTASDLSLSQQSDANKSSHLELLTTEDFITDIDVTGSVTAVVKSSAHPLNNAATLPQQQPPPTAPPKSLSKQQQSSKTTIVGDTTNELIRATKERLYDLLLMSDPNETFIEDFLLTFRIWSEKDLHPSKDFKIMADLMRRICSCIRSNNQLVENCVRIVLMWLVNHYQDFQNENRYLLEEFENALKENSVHKSQLRLFYMHLSAKSLERQVTVTRSDRNAPLIFSLIGGYECSARLFIGEILLNNNNNASPIQSPSSSTATTVSNIDLRPGDRVISINGVDCHVMPIARAYELCRSSTHLSLQVKYDPHLFYALIEGRHETKRQIVETFPLTNRLSTSTTTSSSSSSTSSGFGSSSSTSLSSLNSNQNPLLTTMKDVKKEKEGWKLKVRSLVSSTTNQLISSTTNILHNNSSSTTNNNNNINQSNHNQSTSLSSNSNTANSNNSNGPSSAIHPRILSYEIPEIIKIYSFEHNDCCFLPIHSSTTVRECIQLALRQFKYSNNYSSRDFALYEYSVIFNNNGNNASGCAVGDENAAINNSSTVVKRLNDGTNDLVANLSLNSRLYLKLVSQPKDSSHVGEPMTDSDIAKEIIKDSSINSLLTLKGYAIARELTARDFRLFCKIEAQQFVYDLAFNDPNSSSSNHKNNGEPNIIFDRTNDLQEFERKTNEEMFWTINQVLGEKRSITKRVKAIKQLIRIATLAMKLNNYNTLFAILSGLMHLSISRLKSCWDKVPAKHLKQLQKLQQLMDPSRNFYNFRQQLMQKLRDDKGASIIIPFFPLVKKDLSFIWLANQTYITSAPEPQTPSSQDSNKSNQETLLVNWEKMRLLSEKIREIQKMANTTSLALAAINGLNSSNTAASSVSNLAQSTIATNEPIDPNLLFRIFADQLASPENKSSSDHKKLWENQRMTKRVQSFLDESFSSISSDEHELMSRSYSCELPQTPTSSSHAATTRSSIASTMSSNSQLSHPSPTPSSASSSSNSLSMNSDGTPHGPNNNHSLLYRPHRPKFGQTSPKQLRKLLALSDGAVIVPHSSNQTGTGVSGQNSGSVGHHHHNNNNPSTASNHTNNASHNPHLHHHHHHHHSQHSNNSMYNSSGNNSNSQRISSHHQYQHGSSSNLMDNNGGGSNSTLSSSTSSNYYYGGSHHNPYSSTTLMNMHQHYGNGPTNFHAPHTSSSISNTKTTHPMAMINSPYPNGMCCSTGGTAPIPCCNSGSSSSSLYPNQLYCPCCTPPPNNLMRPSMIMMMPPPQTSGLMHPTCPCVNNNSNGTTRQSSRGRQSNSLPPKQSLPVESSSVTSLRRLDQYSMSRGRGPSGNVSQSSNSSSTNKQSGRRPQCPDYDTTMQRICGGSSSLVTINGSLVGPNGPNSSQTSKSTGSQPTVATVKHHRQASHHREDIV